MSTDRLTLSELLQRRHYGHEQYVQAELYDRVLAQSLDYLRANTELSSLNLSLIAERDMWRDRALASVLPHEIHRHG